MKVLRPVKNKLNGGFTSKHHGYDFDDVPDTNYYSSFHGVVVKSKNTEIRTWIANTDSDPYKKLNKDGKIVKRELRTEDYGNFIKIKAEVDGKTIYQLGAHFRPGTVLSEGTEVKKNQVIAQSDQKGTGNSSGSHSHTEYRDENEKSFDVEFVDEEEEPKPVKEDKRQQITDIYKGTTGEYANEDEISARLQENKNRVEMIEDRLRGDTRAKNKWLGEWGIDRDLSFKTLAESYRLTFEDIKAMLHLGPADNTEEVVAKIQKLIDSQKQQEIIYKVEGVDFTSVIKFSIYRIIIEKPKPIS